MNISNKDMLIIAQNQSNVAGELTKVYCQSQMNYGIDLDKKDVLKTFLEFRLSIINDFKKRFIGNVPK